MKNAIKTLIQKHMTVQTSYKKHVKDWFFNAKIYMYGNRCFVNGGPFSKYFDDIDEGIQFYIDEVLSAKNLGYIWHRLEDKGIDIGNNLDEDTGTFGDYQKTYDKALKTEKKLIKEENKTGE